MMVTSQLRYWNQLKELKTHVIYLHNYASISERWHKVVNIILAISSSSSIAGWAIWQKHELVWATVIAVSQVITAIKPFLPFNQRLKLLNNLNDKLQNILLEMENGWYKVSEGELTDKEIHENWQVLKARIIEAEQKTLSKVILPRKAKLLEDAEKKADLYLKKNYF